MPTPEERRRIFAEVQERSRLAKEKRKKGMAATVADVREQAMEPAEEKPIVPAKKLDKKEPLRKMKSGISFIDLLKKRRRKHEGALKYR